MGRNQSFSSFEELSKAYHEFDQAKIVKNDKDTGQEKVITFVPNTEIVATVGYMIGVEDRILDEYYAYYQSKTLKRVREHREANIIRLLSRIRTTILKHFVNIDKEIVYHLSNIDRMSYFNQEEIKQLIDYGVPIVQSSFRAEKYCEYICTLMERYIYDCKELFPKYVNYEFIKNLFVIPHYKKEKVLLKEYKKYHGFKNLYPHQQYLCWEPKRMGNLLYSDEKFLAEIYSQNNAKFEEKGKLREASDATKNEIYNFVRNSKKINIIVDCENSNPYKIYGVLKGLNQEEIKLIDKIVLYDDIHTTPGWNYLGKLVDIPVEHIEIERINDAKSLVDIKLTAGVCEAYYRDNVDSFILCSSDSDFWGLISSIPTAKFLMLYEYEKCGQAIKNVLTNQNIFHCALDDFSQLDSNELKELVIIKMLEQRLPYIIGQNSVELIDKLYDDAYIEATSTEKKDFFDKVVKNLTLEIDKDKNFYIKINQ